MEYAEKLRNITPDDLIAELESIDSQMDALKKRKKNYESDLLGFLSDEISGQLSSKDYGCGTANVEVGKYKVKAVVSKKVEWNQDELKNVIERIVAAGKKPEEYVKISYEVSEAKYKNWPSDLQNEFVKARTVEPSTPKLSWEKTDASN